MQPTIEQGYHVDRRDALKKLGAGGVVVVGGSMIVSQPAFAYDQPTAGTPASLIASTPALGSTAAVTIADGSASCPNSANDTSASFVSRSITVSTENINGFPAEFRLDGAALPQTTSSSNFTLAQFGTTFGFPSLIVPGDSFSAAISVTWRCTYSDGTTRDLVETTTVVATFTLGGWVT